MIYVQRMSSFFVRQIDAICANFFASSVVVKLPARLIDNGRVFAVITLVGCGLLPLGAQAQGYGVVSINERVTGNQEQPKVIYIVPWQSADSGLGVAPKVESLLATEVFDHVEKPEHAREVGYRNDLSEAVPARQ